MIVLPDTGLSYPPLGATPLLSAHRRFISSDLGDICQHTNEVFTASRPTIEVENGVSRVRFVHNQVNLDHSSLHYIGYHCAETPVCIDLPSMNRHLLLQFSWTGDAEIQQDGVAHHVSQGHFLLVRPGSRMLGRLLPGYQSLVVRIEVEALEVALAKLLGRRPSEQLTFYQEPIPFNGSGNAIASIVFALCHNLDSSAPLMGRNPLSAQMENMLHSLLLFSVPHQYSAELNNVTPPVPYYVHRVEKFIRSNATQPLNVSDLVDAAGTSSRTLQQGFRRFRKTTPMAFLKNVRLELARAALEKPNANSVTQIALDCGFTHLGKFALDYRQRYGERPSETLSRNSTK